jgi:hypothetical protein
MDGWTSEIFRLKQIAVNLPLSRSKHPILSHRPNDRTARRRSGNVRRGSVARAALAVSHEGCKLAESRQL